MKDKYRKKVIGGAEISREIIVKESKTKYSSTVTKKIIKEQALLLECGHKVSKVYFYGRGVPTSNTHCYECQWNAEESPKEWIDTLKNKMLRSVG